MENKDEQNQDTNVWKYMNENWTMDDFKESLMDWKLTENVIQNCDEDMLFCRGCNLLSPSRFVYRTHPFCIFCDTTVQPNFANPINRESVNRYLRSEVIALLDEDQKRHD